MAQFIFTCPHCNQQFNAEEEWIGESTECPGCQQTVYIKKTEQSNAIPNKSTSAFHKDTSSCEPRPINPLPRFSFFGFSCMILVAIVISGIFYYTVCYIEARKQQEKILITGCDILMISSSNDKFPFTWGASPGECRKFYKEFTFSERTAAGVTIYEGLTADGKIHRHGFSDDHSLYFIEMILADIDMKNFLRECNNSEKSKINVFGESVFGTMPNGTVITGGLKNGAWEIMLSNPQFMEKKADNTTEFSGRENNSDRKVLLIPDPNKTFPFTWLASRYEVEQWNQSFTKQRNNSYSGKGKDGIVRLFGFNNNAELTSVSCMVNEKTYFTFDSLTSAKYGDTELNIDKTFLTKKWKITDTQITIAMNVQENKFYILMERK